MADDGRGLTAGEIRILRSVFGDKISYAKVRVYNRKWAFPFPNDRAMAPNGNIYFPGATYEPDFSAANVSVERAAVFVHEGTHLYQWYGLGQTVWARGPFQRDYDYELVPGKKFQDYGLEEMGMIAQHFYLVRNGRRVGKLGMADFKDLLPVR